MNGKTIIITGANAGIGFEAALKLANLKPARLIMACRDAKRGQDAVDKIKAAARTGDDVIVELELLDLGSLKSIREFAERINTKLDHLDVLINNAGLVGPTKRQQTVDGFELCFGVNHLGVFLLTNLLVDLLKKSAPSRVVNVASSAHQMIKDMSWDDLQSEKNYHDWDVYSQSKLANILFSKELARRLEGTKVTSVSLHPGIIQTELFRNTTSDTFFKTKLIKFWVDWFGKKPIDGAKATVHCATSDKIPDQNGLYFDSDATVVTPTAAARNMESAARLWKISAELVGLPVE